MNIISLIASNNFIVLNRTLATKFGLEAAVLLGELSSEYEYWAKKNELIDGGFFYSTFENIQENTTLSERKQRTAIELLKQNGIVNVKLKGLPAKRHIKINMDKLFQVLQDDFMSFETSSSDVLQDKFQQNETYSSDVLQELDVTNRRTNNNKLTIIKNNNKEHLNSCSHSECVNEKPKSEKVFEHDHYAYKAATFLDKKIKENFPNVKDKTEKDLQRWAVDFDYCNRIDGHEWELMSDVLKYSQWDAFWRKNILSGKKFREQFDRLLADMTEAERSGKY